MSDAREPVAQCQEHQTPLVDGYYCLGCSKKQADEIAKAVAAMGGGNITMGALHSRPSMVLIDGRLVKYVHESSCAEFEIPTELASEVAEFVERRIKEINCQCYLCQLNRNRSNKELAA